LIIVAGLAGGLIGASALAQGGTPPEPIGRNLCLSPCALAASPEGDRLFIACAAGNRIEILDPRTEQISGSITTPPSPSGLALSADGTKLYVTCASPESLVCLFDARTAKRLAVISAGHTAMGPVLSPDERTLFVCDRFNDAIGVIDLAKGKEIVRIAVEREPVAAAVTPDGKYLFAVNHLHAGRADVGVVAASVSVIDTTSRQVIKAIALPNGSSLPQGICLSPEGRFAAVTHTLAHFHLPATHVERGWMNNNALSLIDVARLKLVNTILLDELDRGAANPWAVAWTADGKQLCVTHAGTHELSVIAVPALLGKLSKSEKTGATAVSEDLAFLVGLRARVPLTGKGPRALALAGKTAFVADYFSDALERIDLSLPAATSTTSASNNLTKRIELSSGHSSLDQNAELVRRGEMLFNDGTLCLQGWQSCASCHSSEGRVDGLNWDLLNDGIGNPKNVKSLLLAFETGPAMALGVRADAAAAVRAGLRHILFAALPDDYPAALDAYIKSLRPVPSPHLVKGRLSAAARRGKRLFFDERVGCAECHPPPLFTDSKAHRVGTGSYDQPSDRFYTPTLIEAWRTAPYLHDGSAATLRDVVTSRNADDLRGRTSSLTPNQIDDLVAYLESL
jgi:DNA-binding beta-propeller fold protein YncE